ncbi:MAG: type I 3-dehydroquinate dehydratase, partial [Rhodanobacteraceae bacterium]
MKPKGNSSAHRKFRAASQDRLAQHPVKGRGAFVGVIADLAALHKAMRLRQPPDLFELRLDALRDFLPEIEDALPRLRAPLILTARLSAEGGCGALSTAARGRLLRRFLSHARWIDLELRSARNFAPFLAEAQQRKIGVIISSHHLRGTPSQQALQNQLASAIAAGADIFKIATRTDTRAQLRRLLAFFSENRASFPIAAMGLGSRGAESRRCLLRLGSVLNYSHLGEANAPGQLTLAELRRVRAA